MKYSKQETESLIEGLRVTASQCERRVEELLRELAEEENENL